VTNTDTFQRFTPDQLLGPLNEVEKVKAPKFLWAAGAVGLLKLGTRVSIVGSRKASPEGLKRAAKLARILAERNVVVVSGLALGIDTAAHDAAMAVRGGRTIAVLGTPLNVCYPWQNEARQHRIKEEHLAISEFPVGHPVLPGNFPRRNRTMALVTDATVIVEAGEKSGSLHQGWEALRLGRRLFIMRSAATTSGLTWPAEMRKYGAEVLSKPEDLLNVLPVDVGGPLAALTF
jgi:DNA processing protein